MRNEMISSILFRVLERDSTWIYRIGRDPSMDVITEDHTPGPAEVMTANFERQELRKLRVRRLSQCWFTIYGELSTERLLGDGSFSGVGEFYNIEH
jgi:hypothetical protein